MELIPRNLKGGRKGRRRQDARAQRRKLQLLLDHNPLVRRREEFAGRGTLPGRCRRGRIIELPPLPRSFGNPVIVRVGHDEVAVQLHLFPWSTPSRLGLALDKLHQGVEIIGSFVDVLPNEFRGVCCRAGVAASSANKDLAIIFGRLFDLAIGV